MPIVDPFDRHTTNTGIIDPFDAPKSAQLKIKDPFDTTQKPSFLKSAIKAPIAGVGDAIEMYSRALRTTDPEGGWDVIRNVATKGVDLGKSIAEKFPTENEDFGLVKRGVVGGIRSSIPSVAAGIPGAIAGMAGGVPGIVGGYAGSGAIITGAAEYDRFLELADQYGIPKDIARSGAIKSALVEGGIEGAANALDAILLKAGSPVVSGFKQFAKNALKVGGVESGTEAIQAALEAKIARDVGMPAPHPLEAAKEAVIPALTMGGIIGAGGTYANKMLSKPPQIQQTEKQAIIDPFDNQVKPPQIQQTEKQEVVLPPGEKPLIQPMPKPENVIQPTLGERSVEPIKQLDISRNIIGYKEGTIGWKPNEKYINTEEKVPIDKDVFTITTNLPLSERDLETIKARFNIQSPLELNPYGKQEPIFDLSISSQRNENNTYDYGLRISSRFLKYDKYTLEVKEMLKKMLGIKEQPSIQPLPKPENVEIVKPKGFTPIEAAPVVSKEPWQMTKDEYNEDVYQNSDIQRQLITEHEKIRNNKNFDLNKWWNEVDPHKKIIKQAQLEGKPVPPEVLKDYPELQQTHTMPSGEVMPGAEHKETSKFSQPKMFEGEKTNIVPKMEAEIQGQQKLFQPKAGQLTPEQLQQQISDVNIGREGMPSIKSEAEIRYAPGTGINLETLDLPPDIKHTVYKLTQQYQPQFEDARNRKTWEEINKEAEGLGFDANQLLERQKGEAYNAAKLKATKDIQNNTALEAKRIADEAVKLALDAKLTAEQQAEVLAIANMKMKKAAAILAQAGGAYSEAGRALNILRQVSGATKAQKNWNAILDALGGREMTLEMFKRISGMDTTDTPQVAKFIREVQKARTADMVLEAWRNAILSGTKTLITNPLSNAITFASNPIETGIAAALEKGRSVITGKKPQVYFREVPAEIVGAIDGIWNGARVFLNTMKTEIPTFGETKIETAIMQTNIPGKLGRVIRTPQTILMAQDDAMKAVIYDSTMKTLATRLAIRKGLKGKKEIVDFVGNLLTNPQGKNKRLFDLFDKRARADADYRTYNKALGKIGQILMRLREQEFPKGSGIKPLYYVMPFMRTPTNIVKYGLERTPFNFARLGYKTYKGEIPSAHLSEEFAKPIVGTIMFLWGWLMYEYGYMTGDAPKDKNDRATWYNAGKKPYSFYIPWLNRYISYQRIEPLGSIFGMVADFFENIHRGVANTKEAFTKILLSITRNWTNKTFIMGATNAINAYTDPERYGDRFVDGLTSSLVPNIISSFNPDPYYREKQTFLDSIKAKVPVLSETLPPKRDILGSSAKRGESRGMALFNQILPFGVVKPSDDPVRKELLRLNDSIDFSVGMPNKYFRRGKEKIDISADVYDAYSKESGEVAYKLVNRIVKSKGYEKMDDENKASLIRKQFDVARDAIRPKYIRQSKQNPKIGR